MSAVTRTHHRDPDGVTRRIHRRTPTDGVEDRHGKRAEDALMAALAELQAPGSAVISTDSVLGLTTTVTAALGKWHMYDLSLPDSGDGVFVVDTNSAVINSSASRNQITLTLGKQGASYRKMRILEVLTSSDVFTGAQLIAAYAKVKAWYPELAWV